MLSRLGLMETTSINFGCCPHTPIANAKAVPPDIAKRANFENLPLMFTTLVLSPAQKVTKKVPLLDALSPSR
jgi:hypothetical protein